MKKGYVYLICDPINDCFKIGVTRGSIEKRMKKLQTGNCNELYIVDYFQYEKPFLLERMLHNRYKSKNVLNEWYLLESKDVCNFKRTCEDVIRMIDCLKENPFFH